MLHWGRDLGDIGPSELKAFASANVPPVASGATDTPVPLSILPEQSAGWLGTPGITGHRDGVDFSTAFVVTQAETSGPSERDGSLVSERLTVNATDADAKLDLVLELELLPSGLLRERARGHDSTLLLLAGRTGFSYRAGEAWGVHVAWSGNTRTLAEQAQPAGERLLAGGELLLTGEIRLGTDESYESPWVYGSYGNGIDQVSRRFHDYLRARPQHPRSPRKALAQGGAGGRIDFWLYLRNSLIVSTIITVGQVTFSAMAAYAFARLRWRGRNVVFMIFLSALMVPGIFTSIPNFVLMKDLGLLNTFAALALPTFFMTPFAIFFLRQFFLGIPREVEEAALIDGAGRGRVFARIIVPMSSAPITTLAVLTYITSWNEYFWPLLVGQSDDVRVLTVGVATVVSLGLAGCGGEATDSATVITYWMWDSNQVPGYQLCANDFEQANSQIKINIEQYGWDDYWTQLTARMVAESAPDVFVDHSSQFGKYVSLDQLLDVEDRVKTADIDLDQYQKGLPEQWVGPEGGLYGLPKDWDTVGMYYNVDMLADAGCTPEELWTLEWNPVDGGTYEQFLARMTVDENGVRGDEPGFDPNNVDVYAMGYNESGGGYGQVQWSSYVLSNGWEYANQNPWGTVWNYDSPQFIETITWWRSLIKKGYLPSLAIATSGVGTIESVGAGAYAAIIEGSWNARAFNELQGVNVRVAPTPIGPDGARASIINGLSDAIWAGTPHPAEAFAWVEYLASPACQDVVADQGRIFPAIIEASDKAISTFEDQGIDAKAFAVHIEEGTTKPNPVSIKWPEQTQIMKPSMDAIISFKEDPKSLIEANERVNALFR